MRGMKVMFQSDSLEPIALRFQKLIKEKRVSNLQARQASSRARPGSIPERHNAAQGRDCVQRHVFDGKTPLEPGIKAFQRTAGHWLLHWFSALAKDGISCPF